MLKLARRQPAQFTDLFGGAPVFLPVVGGAILLWIGVFLGLILLIIPGIILWLMWWPSQYLILDKKARVIESFSLAAKITQGNWGTTLLLMLLSIGIFLLGCLALCIGTLFAAPLVALLWGNAYLMMSGQLSAQPSYGQYGQYGQPLPPKW